MTMQKILIKGNVPYLYDEPEKPIQGEREYNLPFAKKMKKYEQALTKARESAIPFDRPEEVMKILSWYYDLPENSTHDLPTGYRVEVESKCHCEWYNSPIVCSCTGPEKKAVLTPISKPEEQVNTRTFTTCNGTIQDNGFCNKCFQVGQTTSSYCGRMIEVTPPVEDIKESKELALKIASGIYLKFHEKHNLSLADCEEMADFVLEHF